MQLVSSFNVQLVLLLSRYTCRAVYFSTASKAFAHFLSALPSDLDDPFVRKKLVTKQKR